MQTRERRLAIMPALMLQTDAVTPILLRMPEVERMLVEALAAASLAAARCEGVLTLLAELQRREARSPFATLWDAFDTGPTPHVTRVDRDGAIADPTARDVTPREMQVLRLIAAGKSNKEIAAELGVSVRTIERHITNVYRKIGARGKADATTWVARQRLV